MCAWQRFPLDKLKGSGVYGKGTGRPPNYWAMLTGMLSAEGWGRIVRAQGAARVTPVRQVPGE